jgi:hypothetical protein
VLFQSQVEDNMANNAAQASNGTTIGQLLAAGPQSLLTTEAQSQEPEGVITPVFATWSYCWCCTSYDSQLTPASPSS